MADEKSIPEQYKEMVLMAMQLAEEDVKKYKDENKHDAYTKHLISMLTMFGVGDSL